MAMLMSSRQFEQDAGKAKRAAERGPVYIADHGRPAHVLLTYAAYQRLVCPHDIFELLGQPDGVEDIEFVVPISDEVAQPASFE